MTHKKTKVIVAESSELLRKGLATLLSTKHGLDVTAEVSTGRGLLDHLKKAETDLVLLAGLSDMDSRAVTRILQRRLPDLKVLVLSEQNGTQQSDLMALGACGFLYKNCTAEKLFQAIQRVADGGLFFEAESQEALLNTIKGTDHHLPTSEIRFNLREREIIRYICDGLTNKEIASTLHLSVSTIDFYRTKIYGKTKCNNVTGLLKYALKNGLVHLS